jgi:hypothetical protein
MPNDTLAIRRRLPQFKEIPGFRLKVQLDTSLKIAVNDMHLVSEWMTSTSRSTEEIPRGGSGLQVTDQITGHSRLSWE